MMVRIRFYKTLKNDITEFMKTLLYYAYKYRNLILIHYILTKYTIEKQH